MQSKNIFWRFVCIITLIIFLAMPAFLWADDPELPPDNDEQDTFADVSPDALIVLDLSGSMLWTPAGSKMYVSSFHSCLGSGVEHFGSSGPSHSKECTIDAYGTVPYYSNENCTGPFYTSTQTGYTTNCRRVAIAKRALFNMLDDNADGKVDKYDAETMGIRIGYMRFRASAGDGNDTGGDYSRGNNQLITGISTSASPTGTSYQRTYCGVTGSTSSCLITDTCSGTVNCIARSESADGGTPLVYSLKEAKTYLDDHKASDSAKECRKKFVVLVSDGGDTYVCDGGGAECQSHMYKRRRESVAAAKALSDAGYRIFVLGFGAEMPPYLKNTLNWMAYYGGTNDPRTNDTGAITAYSLPLGCNSDPAVTADCCTFPTRSATGASTTPSACYPGGSSTCSVLTATPDTAFCTEYYSSTFKSTATGSDPGYENLDGYAFLAQDADELNAALKTAMSTIRESTYSFTQASIQAVRTADENYIYEASFEPVNYCPFWPGHLKRFSICTEADVTNGVAGCTSVGEIKANYDWDSGEVLVSTLASARNIFTLIGNNHKDFKTDTTDITTAHLAVATSPDTAGEAQRTMIINYFRGGQKVSTDPDVYWKLGDIFHSSPLSIATPNILFYDKYDKNDPTAYEQYREAHERTSDNGKRLMIVGANDGQLHAFRTGELNGTTGGGSEKWSFIPPNQLSRLKLTAHETLPTSLLRQYYVDGPSSAAEIWIESETATLINNTEKFKSEWMTLLVTSQGRGGMATLWSSSTGCDSGFSPDYSSTFNNYCGYYALDVSDTTSAPTFKWRIGATLGLSETNGKHLAQPWSKMTMGRVRIDNIERWVGLIGGGYSGCGKVAGQCDERGKSFYVIDLKDGSILWTYNYATDSTMNYDLVAGPVAIDYDHDGFWDRAYVGDLGGSIWKFNFCTKSQADATGGCGISSWNGAKLFSEPAQATIRPIYTSVAVAPDENYNIWVYVGTGDKTNPTAPNAQERFYAIKDIAPNQQPFDTGDLQNLGSSGVYDPYATGAKYGWYLEFSGSEKVLAEPVVYQGHVYFTSYVPNKGGSDPCNTAGEAFVYNMDYVTGAGLWDGERGISLGEGTGVPSAVVVSVAPDGSADLYVSTSVAVSGVGHGKKLSDDSLKPVDNRLIYWQDMRVQ